MAGVKFMRKRHVGLFAILFTFSFLSMPPIHAIEEWLLNSSYKYDSGYCFTKSAVPTLQVKQWNGKWKNTRAVPKSKKSKDCPKKSPFDVSFRIKPRDLGITFPAEDRRVQVSVRIKTSRFKGDIEKVNVFRSKYDYDRFWE